MRDVFFFENMLTPKIIIIVYWLMLASAIFGGIAGIFSGEIIAGTIALIFGVVGARIFCELLIVAFKMNEALQDIRSK
ncbi:MAG: DUF4282 domain-containing protein [Gammaproteobacteria bacterium]|nr:DUF4282 domain-containing protein [Gammaproteobacteria bacterium]